MSFTITETGKVLSKTEQGISMPVDYSFATVNSFVHGMGVQFEDLVNLCLVMADHIDKMKRGEFICTKCGLRKDSERREEFHF